jgi:hypothetical protein
MIEDTITIHLISGMIDAARRIIGDSAVKAANEVEGLVVSSNGEIVVTGDVLKIIGSLCSVLEKALKAKLVVDVEVRLNLKR